MEAIRLQSWYATSQGQTVTQIIGDAMQDWLGRHRVERTFGFGYTQPYMDRLLDWTDTLWGASPAEMGVDPWPIGGDNRIALVRPDALPFPDALFDRVIVTHLLEGTDSPRAALRESWRVLKPGGRLFLMVANRGGLWAQRDTTPFGWSGSFSPGQIQFHLHDTLFLQRQLRYALFIPPWSGNKRWLNGAGAWEKAGQRWFAPFGGVILCEAEKVVYASSLLVKQVESSHTRHSMVVIPTKARAERTVQKRNRQE
ncbi:MAG: class I SAM-dependent methyltransferase [Magnetococcus sp. DMHC-6]